MSLFDEPKELLNPALFTSEEEMRQDIRIYILNDINSFMVQHSMTGVFLLGSMAGRQYSSESDIDINLVLRPKLRREQVKERVKEFSGRLLPGTDHPINYYVQNFVETNFEGAEYAVYDLIRNL